ncbi:MAG: LCP family protein [Actinomycetota bacterium]
MAPVDGEGAQQPGSGSAADRRGYPRFLGYAALGALLPGIGLVAAGRRKLGWSVFAVWAVVVASVVVAALWLGLPGLVALSSDAAVLDVIGPGLLFFAELWLVVAVVSLYVLEPIGLRGMQRLSGALAVTVAASLVVAPLALAARYSATHNELLDRVFASGEQRSLTSPTEEPDAEQDDGDYDPWAGRSRVNVLLLGSDAGKGREGVRPDTLILASTDTQTGDTVLLSLPRNLERVPFPEESPLHELYPNGFTGPGHRNAYLLFSIYKNVPAMHPEIFEESSYPGADATKWAVEGILGIDVDYFAMVDLKGFRQLVDALGGITLDVNYRIPIGTQVAAGGGCTPAIDWIEPGQNKRLDGMEALWFARARCGPYPITDDFNRMERQRCVIGAIVEAAQPTTVLRHYERIAGATGNLVLTDIPQDRLPAFVDLSFKVKDASISSLAFTDEVVESRANPDYDRIRELAADALSTSPAEATQTPGSSSPTGSAPSPTGTVTPGETPPTGQDAGPGETGSSDGDEGDEDEEDDEPAAESLTTVC